jgi:hypothetical protein
MTRSDIEQECLDIIRASMDNLTSRSALTVIEANRELTRAMTQTQLTRYLTVLRGVSAPSLDNIEAKETDMESIQIGKAGTVSRKELTNAEMGDGAGKPTQVILEGILKLYVGFGWIDQRPARQFDADFYPVVVE